MHRGGAGNNNNIDMVAVAIDKDRGSQHALKWAVDNLLGKGKNVTLLHVKQKPPSTSGLHPPSILSYLLLMKMNHSLQVKALGFTISQ